MIESKKWIPYKRKAKCIEINIKDHYEQSIGFFKIIKGNTRDIKRILDKLKNEYGFDLTDKNNESFTSDI